MKRSSVFLYLGLWCASLALSFVAGRGFGSADVNHVPPSHQHQPDVTLWQAQTMRTPLNPPPEAEETTLGSLALGTETEARVALLDRETSVHTHRLLEAAFALPLSDPRRSKEIRDLLEHLARSDPRAALELSDRITSLREAQRTRAQILEQWATHDPMTALAWATDALADVPTNLRNSQMLATLRGFAQTNPAGAFQYASALDDSTPSAMRLKERLLSEVIETQIRGGGLQDAQTTIALMPEGQSKNNLQRELVNEWAAFDPHSAAAYVQSLGDGAPSNLKTDLIAEWAKNDPPAAATWLNSLPEGDPVFAKASATITREWTLYDLAASSEWLNSLPASPELDRAVAAYTARASQEDPATAMSWAESINNDGLRTRMMQKVAGNWKSDAPAAFTAYLDDGDFSSKERKLLESAKAWPSNRRDWK